MNVLSHSQLPATQRISDIIRARQYRRSTISSRGKRINYAILGVLFRAQWRKSDTCPRSYSAWVALWRCGGGGEPGGGGGKLAGWGEVGGGPFAGGGQG